MMRLAFRGLYPRMLGASGRRLRGGPTLRRPSYHTLAGSRPRRPRRSDDLDPQLRGRNKRRFFEDRPCPGAFQGCADPGRASAVRIVSEAVRRMKE